MICAVCREPIEWDRLALNSGRYYHPDCLLRRNRGEAVEQGPPPAPEALKPAPSSPWGPGEMKKERARAAKWRALP